MGKGRNLTSDSICVIPDSYCVIRLVQWLSKNLDIIYLFHLATDTGIIP